MNYSKYNQFADSIRNRSGLMLLIHFFNMMFTATGFVMYPVLLICIWQKGIIRSFLVCLVIPGIAFVAVSVFRKYFNAKRPYEMYPIHPLIDKEKKGESFPSRHIFSIMLIGGLWFNYFLPVGIIILVCGIGLAVIRVIGGVHFLKDVIWGTMLGITTAVFTIILI